MDSYYKALSQKQLKMKCLLILAKQLKEAAHNDDLMRIDYLTDKRQVLMNDIDVLDRELFLFNQPDGGSVHYRQPTGEVNAGEHLLDAIKIIIHQIKHIDNDTLEALNQSRKVIQRKILVLHQERKAKKHSKFLDIET